METAMQHLDDLQSRLLRALRVRRNEQAAGLSDLRSRLRVIRPGGRVREEVARLQQLSQALQNSARSRWREIENRLAQSGRSLQLLSPQNILDRGYSITRDAVTGEVGLWVEFDNTENIVLPGSKATLEIP